MKIPFLAALFFCTQLVDAQVFTPIHEGPASLGLGGATVALNGLHSPLANPAGLAFLKKTTAATASISTPFFQTEWKKMNVAAMLPAGSTGHFGLVFGRNGIPEFHENVVRLAYGRKLSNRIGFGATMDMLSLVVPEYGKTGGLTIGLGILARLSEAVQLGGFVHNPLIINLKSGERLPSGLRVGAVWQPGPAIKLLAEIEKNLLAQAVVKTGIEYGPNEKTRFRIGCRTGPIRLAGGAGLVLKRGISTDFSMEWHPVLGLTPAVSVAWRK